jgi:hypothetical protein
MQALIDSATAHHLSREVDTPWVSVSERLPAGSEADARGDVIWLRSGIEMLGRVREQAPVDATHWRRNT